MYPLGILPFTPSVAGHHEQRISELEKNLEEKEVYISNIECLLADLSGRVSEMEGKLCRCREEEDAEVADTGGRPLFTQGVN